MYFKNKWCNIDRIEDSIELARAMELVGYGSIPYSIEHKERYAGFNEVPEYKSQGGISQYERDLPNKWGKCTLEEGIRWLDKHHPGILPKYYPHLFYISTPQIDKLRAQAQRSKGAKRNRLFARANKLHRRLNSV
jgi:hypothetical protein